MKYAVLDFETTGTRETDRIIEIGLTVMEDQRIVHTYSSLARPDMPLPDAIVRLTGITDEMLRDAPGLAQALEPALPHLENVVLVAHNAMFDYLFLQRSLSLCGFDLFDGPVLDTMDMLRMLFPGLASLQLSRVCAALGVPHETEHRAEGDAIATAGCWSKILQRLDELPLLTVQRLSHIFDQARTDFRDLAWFLNEIRGRREERAALDMDSSSYFRQFALNVNDWKEEEQVRTDNELQDLNPDFDLFYAEAKQRLSEYLTHYEERKSQDEMASHVYEAFTGEHHLMVEAGTGTGKSLGYLIPALHFGLLNQRRVVVSTHTINLQEQIKERDLPLLQRIFDVPFKAAVFKGRNHYLCLRKFEHKINAQDFADSKEDKLMAGQMLVWLGDTGSGDVEELHFQGNRKDFWRTVESDADSCLNRACPWFKKCFYHRSRNAAHQADIVVTNHSLLFTDVKAEHRLLPAYDQLIIDEAHHFEEVASKHLGTEIYYNQFINLLNSLGRDAKNGQLPQLVYQLQQVGEDHAEACAENVQSLIPDIQNFRTMWEELAELSYGILNNGKDAGAEGGQYVTRLKPGALPRGWEQTVTAEDNLYVTTGEFLRKLERAMAKAEEWEDEHEGLQGLLTDLNGTVKELQTLREQLHFIVQAPDEGHVYWLEAGSYHRHKSLCWTAVPLDISPLLRTAFFESKESVVMTSATLSVGKTFDYVSGQLGLQEELKNGRLQTFTLPSPFKYRDQALVCVPRDFPGVSTPSFIDELAASIRDIALATAGRMMVLFTSYRMLKQVHGLVKELLAPRGIQVLGQGVDSGSRSKLTRLFQDNPNTVLLGTSSFWEGVDIPGDALTCLAIVRLPFQPPNHPLVEAKCEAVKKMNKNPFTAYSVPQAVIRFKQGFGRLIRTAQDKGIVVIYDTRVIESYYGKQFLYSLPGPKIEHMPGTQLVGRIEEWLEPAGQSAKEASS